MKTPDQLAAMTHDAFERWLKRNRFTGMAAVNLAAKRRRGIQAQQASFDVAVKAASTLSRAALVEAGKEAVALGSDCAD